MTDTNKEYARRMQTLYDTIYSAILNFEVFTGYAVTGIMVHRSEGVHSQRTMFDNVEIVTEDNKRDGKHA